VRTLLTSFVRVALSGAAIGPAAAMGSVRLQRADGPVNVYTNIKIRIANVLAQTLCGPPSTPSTPSNLSIVSAQPA
jgi:hypothetical protein